MFLNRLYYNKTVRAILFHYKFRLPVMNGGYNENQKIYEYRYCAIDSAGDIILLVKNLIKEGTRHEETVGCSTGDNDDGVFAYQRGSR
jgi:hypothetical protein